jgi:hypothetical protein
MKIEPNNPTPPTSPTVKITGPAAPAPAKPQTPVATPQPQAPGANLPPAAPVPAHLWGNADAPTPEDIAQNPRLPSNFLQTYFPQSTPTYRPTFWDDPRRVARYYLASQSTPPGSKSPDWLDTSSLEFAYNYFKAANDNKPWYTWQPPAEDDPIRETLNAMPLPPPGAVKPDEWTFYGQPSTSNDVGIANAQPDQGISEPKPMGVDGTQLSQADFDKLPFDQKVAIWTGTNVAPWFEQVGQITGKVPGLNEGFSFLGQALSFPSEIIKRSTGLLGQVLGSAIDPGKYGSINEIIGSLDKLRAALDASAETYKAVNLADLWQGGSQGRNVYQLGSATPSRLDPSQYGMAALVDLRRQLTDIYTGKSKASVDDVMQAYDQRFGFSGMEQDLVGSMLADPLNLLGLGESKIAEKAGELTGNDALRLAALATRGEGAHLSGGLIDIAKLYGQETRLTKPLEEISKMDRLTQWLADVGTDAAGNPIWKSLQTEPSKNPLARAANWMFGLTPKARADEITVQSMDAILNAFADEQDPATIMKLVGSIGNGSPETAGQVSRLVFGGPEGTVIPLAIRDAQKPLQDMFENMWEIPAQKRGVILKWADLVGMKPEALIREVDNGKGADTVLELMKDKLRTNGSKEAVKLLKSFENPQNSLTGAQLYDTARHFMTGDWALTADEFKYKLAAQMTRHVEEWATSHFGVAPEPWAFRLSKTIKNVQSLVLLAPNVPFGINNAIDNTMKMAWSGVFNLDSPARQAKFWEAIGFVPERLQADLGGMAGEVGQAIKAGDEASYQIGDISREAMKVQDPGWFEHFRGKVDQAVSKAGSGDWAIGYRMSRWTEKSSGVSAMTEGMKRAYYNLMRPGRGIDKMASETEGMLRSIGIDPEYVYRSIAGSHNMAEIESKLWEGYGYRALEQVVEPKDLEALRQAGVYDVLSENLSKASSVPEVRQAFQDTFNQVQEKVNTQTAERLKNVTEQTTARVIGEGIQAAMEQADRIAMDFHDFWTNDHFDNMADIFEQAKGMSVTDARRFKKARFIQSANEWVRKKENYAAQLEGVWKAWGADDPTMSALKDELTLQHQGWQDYFDIRSRLHNNYNAAEEGDKKALAALNSELGQIMGIDIPAVNQTPYSMIQDALNKSYRDHYAVEMDTQGKMDGLFTGLVEKQFRGSKPAADVWRAGIRDVRQLMAEAQIYFRAGDGSGLDQLGERGQALKGSINAILKGRLLKDLDAASKDQAWRNFTDSVYRPLILKHLQENQTNSLNMYKAALQSARDLGQTTAKNSANEIRRMAFFYGVPTATKEGVPLDKTVLSIVKKYTGVEAKTLDEIPEDVARQAFEARAKGEPTALEAVKAGEVIPQLGSQIAPAAGPKPILTEDLPQDVREAFDRYKTLQAARKGDANVYADPQTVDKWPKGAGMKLNAATKKAGLVRQGDQFFKKADMDVAELEAKLSKNASRAVAQPGGAIAGRTTPAINTPLGTVEGFTEAPLAMAEEEAWTNQIKPLLSSIEEKYASRAVGETPKGGLADQIREAVKQQYPGASNEEIEKLVNAGIGHVKGYLEGTVKPQMREVKLASLRYGEQSRDMALLNYRRRTGFDNLAGMVFPYQFWYTRSMLNWALRALDRPAMLSNYVRLKEFQQGLIDRPGFPYRLGKKMGIPLPFLPDWMGDGIYIDPLKDIFGFEQQIAPFTKMAEQDNTQTKRTISILQQMQADETADPTAVQAAIENKQGQLWDKAWAQSSLELDNEINNPFDFLSLMSGPSLPIQIGYNLSPWGDKANIGQLPPTRMIQALTGAVGIGGPGGVNIESGFRKMVGLPQGDQFADYRVDRMLAGLTAEGQITPGDAQRAMIDRSGPAFDLAQTRVSQMGVWQYLGGPIGLDFFPEGEKEQRDLQTSYDAMMAKWKAGDTQARNEWFDAHPEYAAQLTAWEEDPVERLRSFLRSEVWERYNALSALDKRQVSDQLGAVFQDAFLNKETRSYDSIDTATLAAWSKALGSKNPVAAPDAPALPLKFADPDISKTYQNYVDAKKQLFPHVPDLNTVLYKMPADQQDAFRKRFPEVGQYTKWNNLFLATHPEIIPFAVGKDNELYGVDTPTAQAVYQYRALKDQLFPNLDAEFDEYNKIDPNADSDVAYPQTERQKKAGKISYMKQRAVYRQQHPDIDNYYKYRDEFAAQNPKAAPYILSANTLSDMIGGSDQQQLANRAAITQMINSNEALTRQLYLSAQSSSGQLSTGTLMALEGVWTKLGKPEENFYDWVDDVVKPIYMIGS